MQNSDQVKREILVICKQDKRHHNIFDVQYFGRLRTYRMTLLH